MGPTCSPYGGDVFEFVGVIANTRSTSVPPINASTDVASEHRMHAGLIGSRGAVDFEMNFTVRF